ncbi:hypothetical protein BHM03_00062040, partial [Ensete ventricosum]
RGSGQQLRVMVREHRHLTGSQHVGPEGGGRPRCCHRRPFDKHQTQGGKRAKTIMAAAVV